MPDEQVFVPSDSPGRYCDVTLAHVLASRLGLGRILTEIEPMTGAMDVYKAFDERQPGWLIEERPPGA